MKIKSIEEWTPLAQKIVSELKHNILLLHGNLGAGKTTFTQHLVASLGSADEVTSPTYTIVNEYHSSKGKIFHFDLYRIKSIEELFDIGIEDYLHDGFLSIIEWPEIYSDELEGLDYHEMTIENKGDFREITFK